MPDHPQPTSKCCHAPLEVAGGETKHYVCTACGKPSDPTTIKRISEEPEPCDHDWQFVDDSFDHEFGCERIHYMRCEKCDATKDCERDSGPIAGEDYDIP